MMRPLAFATLLALSGCYETYDLDCDEPVLSPSSVAETPNLEDLEVPVEDFIVDLEGVRLAQLVAGDRNGKLPEGQSSLPEPAMVEIELAYEREGELVTPEDNPICGVPYLQLPVRLTVRHEGETLITATGEGPVGYQRDGFPRAEMDALFAPALWDLLGVEPPAEARPIASMYVFYRDAFAESVDITLRHCDRSQPGCPVDFAHISWER